MVTLVAVYRGATVGSAELVAVSADPALVADVSARLLAEPADDAADDDPVIRHIESGRRAALRAIKREATDAPAR